MPAGEAGVVPLFRSATQFRLLGQLAADPERKWTIAELASVIGAAPTTVWKEVDRLRETGLVDAERVGRALQVSVASVPPSYFGALRQLLLQTYGPLPLLHRELSQISGVREAWVYGSWARRYAGETGRQPGDVDVLVVVDSDADSLELFQAAARVGSAARVVVNPTVMTAAEWEADMSAFAEEVRASPRVDVLGESYGKVVP